MPLPGTIRQQRFTERSMNPMSNRFVTGLSGGVPKMHPLKSNISLISKGASLMHGIRLKKLPILRLKKY